MKLFLFLLFFPLFGFNQILDTKKEWFETDGFFNVSDIKKNRIKTMEFVISTKKDGDIIKKSSERLFFSFNRSGLQIYGKRILESKYKKDTTEVLYLYNRKGLISSKIDEFSVFRFKYNYTYNEGNQLIYELKLDAINKRNDTLYERFYTHILNNKTEEVITLNSSKRPFYKKYVTRIDNVETEKGIYLRNRKFLEVRYFRIKEKLVQKETSGSLMGKSVIREEFIFKNEKLDEINIYKNGKLSLKRGVIYNGLEMPINIIERQYEAQAVKIYKVNYTFY